MARRDEREGNLEPFSNFTSRTHTRSRLSSPLRCRSGTGTGRHSGTHRSRTGAQSLVTRRSHSQDVLESSSAKKRCGGGDVGDFTYAKRYETTFELREILDCGGAQPLRNFFCAKRNKTGTFQLLSKKFLFTTSTSIVSSARPHFCTGCRDVLPNAELSILNRSRPLSIYLYLQFLLLIFRRYSGRFGQKKQKKERERERRERERKRESRRQRERVI